MTLHRDVRAPSASGTWLPWAAVALVVAWGGRVPATSGQLALLVLGAAITMEAVALLLVLFPPV